MVAHYLIGEPVRSFVRVPNSGKDKDIMPTCLDLSRVANIAPAKRLPTSLFANLPKKKIDVDHQTKRQTPIQVKKSLKRGINEETVLLSKKACTIKPSYQALENKCENLQEQNNEMSKKIRMLCSLFKNRSKLDEVLKLLDETTASR